MSDCRFGVSPVNYHDPDPDPELLWPMGLWLCLTRHRRIVEAQCTEKIRMIRYSVLVRIRKYYSIQWGSGCASGQGAEILSRRNCLSHVRFFTAVDAHVDASAGCAHMALRPNSFI